MNGRNLYPMSASQKNLHSNMMIQKNHHYLQPRQLQTHNLYYDNNPYFLNQNLNQHKLRGLFNTSRNSNQSRQISQASSQRSGKLIRTNGLKLAQKPRLVKQKIIERQSRNKSNQQTRKLYEKNIQLEERNKLLINQNQKLYEKIKMMEEIHKKQIQSLSFKIEGILLAANQIQKNIEKQAIQWKAKLQQIQNMQKNNNKII